MRNPFNDLLRIAQRWADNPAYAQIIACGKSIADGATPDKADAIINDVIPLYGDMIILHDAIPSDDAFYIATAYAYYADDSLISMTQLAIGLAWARANNADYIVIDDQDIALTNQQRSYASKWMLSHRIRTYKKPNTNKSQSNHVLVGDVIEALGDDQ